MDYLIREMKINEYPLLEDFLYEAIFIPDGVDLPSRDIVKHPDLLIYYKGFGKYKDDICLVAEVEGKIVGAVWVRKMHDYGYVDDNTPSLSISLYKEYRNKGIGTAMMKEFLKLLKSKNYSQVSLSVQSANYAHKMYLDLGFEIVEDKDEEYIMICKL